MDTVHILTGIVMYAIEIVGVTATINGILTSNTVSMFAGVLLYITMRSLDEKQVATQIKGNILGRMNLGEEEKGDESLWLLFQLLLVAAMILLATL